MPEPIGFAVGVAIGILWCFCLYILWVGIDTLRKK